MGRRLFELKILNASIGIMQLHIVEPFNFPSILKQNSLLVKIDWDNSGLFHPFLLQAVCSIYRDTRENSKYQPAPYSVKLESTPGCVAWADLHPGDSTVGAGTRA